LLLIRGILAALRQKIHLTTCPNSPGHLSPAAPLPTVQVPTPSPGRFMLLHPQALDSATLAADGRTVALDGILALPDPSGGLQRYLRAQGDQVECDVQGAGFACALPDGTDVALVSLANGAARATADAPEAYRQQEAAAQAARRGAWANLPPPPVTVPHPLARTSVLLVLDGQSFALDGLQGLPGQPAQELQGYIAAHGDSVTCQQQPGGQSYVCLLPDGTDVGKAALVNGAARAAPGAPDAYLAQQADAVANRRGIWAAAPAPLPVVVAPAVPVHPVPLSAVPAVPAYPAPVPNGPVPDGPVAYLGDQPTAVIDGEQALFVFGGAALGWGYWDHARRWHGAPDRHARQLERSHPDGRLAGRGGFGLGGAGRAGFVPSAGLRDGSGGFAPDRGRAGPAFMRPVPEFARPGFARPGFVQLGLPQQGFARQSPRIGRPGLAVFAGRPALPVAAPRLAVPMIAPRPAPPSLGGRHR